MNIGVDVYTNARVSVNLVAVRGDEDWISLIFADDITGFDMAKGDRYELVELNGKEI